MKRLIRGSIKDGEGYIQSTWEDLPSQEKFITTSMESEYSDSWYWFLTNRRVRCSDIHITPAKFKEGPYEDEPYCAISGLAESLAEGRLIAKYGVFPEDFPKTKFMCVSTWDEIVASSRARSSSGRVFLY